MMAGRGAPASRAGELVTDSEKRFLITEPLEGQSLGERLRAPLEIAEAIDIAIGIATGLAAAHRAGVIHSDLKPDNVMIRNDGVVKLLDFGVATLMENPATVSTTTATADPVLSGRSEARRGGDVTQ